jgi:hypothetical protein
MSGRKSVWRRLGRTLLASVLLVGVGAMSTGCIFVGGGHHHHHWHDDW